MPLYAECRTWVEKKFKAVFGQNLRTDPKKVAAYVPPPAWIALLDYGMEINLDECLGWA